MKKAVILSVFSCIALVSFSQTKRIAHRSHSGSNATFNYSVAGNFGLPAEEKKKTAPTKKDSLKNKISPAKDSIPAVPKNIPDSVKQEKMFAARIYYALVGAKHFFDL